MLRIDDSLNASHTVVVHSFHTAVIAAMPLNRMLLRQAAIQHTQQILVFPTQNGGALFVRPKFHIYKTKERREKRRDERREQRKKLSLKAHAT